MCNLTRRLCLASLATIVVAGCGDSITRVWPPPGKRKVTLHVKEMSARLKLM
jgi:hypothetical protein